MHISWKPLHFSVVVGKQIKKVLSPTAFGVFVFDNKQLSGNSPKKEEKRKTKSFLDSHRIQKSFFSQGLDINTYTRLSKNPVTSGPRNHTLQQVVAKQKWLLIETNGCQLQRVNARTTRFLNGPTDQPTNRRTCKGIKFFFHPKQILRGKRPTQY